MKKLIILCVVTMSAVNGQTKLHLSGGVTFSRLDWQLNGSSETLYDRYRSGYSFEIGVTLLPTTWIRSTTSVGLFQKGGNRSVQIYDNTGSFTGTYTDAAMLNYLSLSTIAALQRPLGVLTPFVGIGPRLSFIIGHNHALNAIDKSGDLNALSVGLELLMGVSRSIREWEVGVKASYLMTTPPIADWPKTQTNSGGRIGDRTGLISLFVERKL